MFAALRWYWPIFWVEDGEEDDKEETTEPLDFNGDEEKEEDKVEEDRFFNKENCRFNVEICLRIALWVWIAVDELTLLQPPSNPFIVRYWN